MINPVNHVWNSQTPVFNTPADDDSHSIDVDAYGDLLLVYSSTANISGGMNQGLSDIIITKVNGQTGTHMWSKQIMEINTASYETFPIINSDALGFIFVTYLTQGTVSGGSKEPTNSTNVVVIKLTTNGDLIWTKQNPIIDTTVQEYFPKLVIDSDGNAIVTYLSSGVISGGSDGSNLDNILIILKLFGLTGNLLWTSQSPLFDVNIDPATFTNRYSLTIDREDNLIIASQSSGSISGGSTNNSDIVVFKIAGSTGKHIWTNRSPVFDSNTFDFYPSVVTDSQNAIYVTYTSEMGTVSGGSPGPLGQLILFKLTSNGKHLWNAQIPKINQEHFGIRENPDRIQIDRNDDVIIMFVTKSSVSGGSGLSTNDIAIIKFTGNNGTHQWTYLTPVFNTSASVGDFGATMTMDRNGSIYIAYANDDIVSAGSLTNSNTDIILVKLQLFYEPVICVHEDMIVDDLQIPIKHVHEYTDDFVKLVFTGKTKEFIRIGKGALEPGIPTQDLLLTPGHRILYGNKKVKVKNLTFKPGINYVILPEYANTYDMCFKRPKAVKIHGVDVFQLGKKTFQKLLKKKGWEYYENKGIYKKFQNYKIK